MPGDNPSRRPEASPRRRKVLESLLNGPLVTADIAARVRITHSQAYGDCRWLEKEGLVASELTPSEKTTRGWFFPPTREWMTKKNGDRISEIARKLRELRKRQRELVAEGKDPKSLRERILREIERILRKYPLDPEPFMKKIKSWLREGGGDPGPVQVEVHPDTRLWHLTEAGRLYLDPPAGGSERRAA